MLYDTLKKYVKNWTRINKSRFSLMIFVSKYGKLFIVNAIALFLDISWRIRISSSSIFSNLLWIKISFTGYLHYSSIFKDGISRTAPLEIVLPPTLVTYP